MESLDLVEVLRSTCFALASSMKPFRITELSSQANPTLLELVITYCTVGTGIQDLLQFDNPS